MRATGGAVALRVFRCRMKSPMTEAVIGYTRGPRPPEERDRFNLGSSEPAPCFVIVMEFETLYRQHAPAVYRFALSITRRKEIAEDLTSDAFLALHREMSSIDPALLPAWLLTVVRNRARDLWRHQLIEERYAVEKKPDVQPTAPPALSLEEWILEGAGLKPVHRLCVMLRYVSGMTRAEIAIETGLTEVQVKGHLQYALTLLRKAHGVAEV
jgi:RNA polymerase sigma-70 factor (ECF subfamily)